MESRRRNSTQWGVLKTEIERKTWVGGMKKEFCGTSGERLTSGVIELKITAFAACGFGSWRNAACISLQTLACCRSPHIALLLFLCFIHFSNLYFSHLPAVGFALYQLYSTISHSCFIGTFPPTTALCPGRQSSPPFPSPGCKSRNSIFA